MLIYMPGYYWNLRLFGRGYSLATQLYPANILFGQDSVQNLYYLDAFTRGMHLLLSLRLYQPHCFSPGLLHIYFIHRLL